MRAKYTFVLGLIMAIAAHPAPAEIKGPLLPGELVGSASIIPRPKGMSLKLVASYHGVFRSQVTVRDDGKLHVDQRRIMPTFHPWVDGIVLNVPEAHVYLVSKGKIVKDYPAGVSKSDWRVPIGQTKVKEMRENPTWYVPKSIQEEMRKNGEEVKEEVPPGPDNPLGSRWIGFYDGSYGFHGTTSPHTIKDFRSHGCVRMFDPNVQDLYGRVKFGTPVRVYYQPVKLAVDGDRIWLTSHRDIYGFYHRKINPGAMARGLAVEAGVLGRIDWQKVGKALREQNGIPIDVALAKNSRSTVPISSASR